jgi:putative spermidine/putrescine transport system permease protein
MANSQKESNRSTGFSFTNVVSIRRLLQIHTGIILLFIYIPVLTLIIFSFNSGGLNFPVEGFTFSWYTDLFNDQATVAAISRSLQLAVVVTLLGTPMATAAAIAYLYGFPGKKLLLYLLITGIVVPGITFSIGSNLFLVQTLNFDQSLLLAIPVHIVWSVPFATIFLIVAIPSNLAEQDAAARSMGASRWTVFRRVIFPQIAKGFAGAALVIFTLSYNEGTRALLLLGSDRTIPDRIFNVSASADLTPQLFALGSVTAFVSVLLLAVLGYVFLFRNE